MLQALAAATLLLQLLLLHAAPAAELHDGQPNILIALGGSNTLGAKDMNGTLRGSHKSFGQQLYESLKHDGLIDSFKNFGIGAMGPMLAGSCTNTFVPAGTAIATVEYLPNIGYTNDDAGELAAIKQILLSVLARGGKPALVNILPGASMERFAHCVEGRVGCTTRAHVERLHTSLLEMAAHLGVPSVTMDYESNATVFSWDKMHLNQLGHDEVHAQLLSLYKDASRWPSQRSSHSRDEPAEELPVRCYLGDQLADLVSHSTGFAKVNFGGGRADKVGWEARNASASLTLCTRFPRDASPPPPPPPSAPPESSASRPAAKLLSASHKPPGHAYAMAVGLQMSHDLNPPLFGHARIRCAGACRCNCFYSHHGAFNASCIFDGLIRTRISITAFARLAVERVPPTTRAAPDEPGSPMSSCPDDDQCAVIISNSDDEAVRHRVLVRALIIGLGGGHYSTKFLNTYHLDVSGLTFSRRQLSAKPPASQSLSEVRATHSSVGLVR